MADITNNTTVYNNLLNHFLTSLNVAYQQDNQRTHFPLKYLSYRHAKEIQVII